MELGIPEKIIAFLQEQDPEKVFKLTRFYKNRTTKQNSYLHVIFTALALEVGMELLEIKGFFKYQFLQTVTPNGMEYVRDTAELDTKETTDFIRSIKIWALENLNFVIPDPDTEEALKFYDYYIKN